MTVHPSATRLLHTIPIADRPAGGGSLWSKIFFPLFFNIGIVGLHTAAAFALPLLLIPYVGRGLFELVVDWAKDSFGRLLIFITVLFAPTSLHITVDAPPYLTNLIERDQYGRLKKLNLPDRLVIMSNHQAYMDWMYMWILACYAGHARGIVILLKWSLRGVPIIGWSMRMFRFIFMKRSWAADKDNLTKSLTNLGRDARISNKIQENTVDYFPGIFAGLESEPSGSDKADKDEAAALLPSKVMKKSKRSPLWLLIFPEGTITSDEERVKSVKYAEREGVDDFVTMLHPRSTGLLFCLRTLLPQIPDLQLLDVTIGYPGVPYGKYPQDHYGLMSVFFRSVPPPTVHMHLHLYDNLTDSSCPIPSLITPQLPPSPSAASNGQAAKSGEAVGIAAPAVPPSTALATPDEARKFELWLRGVWTAKEKRLGKFYEEQVFAKEKEGRVEVVKIRQVKWFHWFSAMGFSFIGTAFVVVLAIVATIVGLKEN